MQLYTCFKIKKIKNNHNYIYIYIYIYIYNCYQTKTKVHTGNVTQKKLKNFPFFSLEIS
jgi:hypothetical protein